MINKILLLIVFAFCLNISEAQVSVAPRHIGKLKKFPKGQLDDFKKTTTVFVLSDIIDNKTYNEILNHSWTVTPFKVVNHNDFEIAQYLDGKHSFAILEGYHKQVTSKSGIVSDYVHIYVNFYYLNEEKLKKDINKLKKGSKKYKRKLRSAFSVNSLKVARIDLFPKDKFYHKALSSDTESILETIFEKDVFYNYKTGFLKNYFQKVNNLISENKNYWMYDNDYDKELKNLSKKTLYIPSYHQIKYNPWKMEDSKKEDEFDKVFSAYNYKYEYQDADELNRRILAGEEFYYLRYVRVNSQKFIHVVNSKTGEIVYRNYVAGLLSSYNIKSRHVKDLNSLIKKALKK